MRDCRKAPRPNGVSKIRYTIPGPICERERRTSRYGEIDIFTLYNHTRNIYARVCACVCVRAGARAPVLVRMHVSMCVRLYISVYMCMYARFVKS